MPFDIKKLLRADHPAREPALPAFPNPEPMAPEARVSNLPALARDLGNLSLTSFPTGVLSGPADACLKLGTWKAAVFAVPDDPTFTFPASIGKSVRAGEGDGLVVSGDSDMATVIGSERTVSSASTYKAVNLLSWEDIHCQVSNIPPSFPSFSSSDTYSHDSR